MTLQTLLTELRSDTGKGMGNHDGEPLSDFDLRELSYQHFGRVSPTDALPQEGVKAFLEDVTRLREGYPLQYLLGEWEFYGLPFVVGEGVLIPRQDTETLIDLLLELFPKEAPIMMADFCAGSGAISIASAVLFPKSQVLSVELSEDAIGYLRENITLNHVESRVTVLKADVLSPPELPSLDVLVSNPPYIATAVVDTLSKQVSYEPRMALDGGNDGLVFYRSIVQTATKLLKPGGWLMFEIGYDQGQAVAELLTNAGFQEVQIRKDLTGNDRCVYGRVSSLDKGTAAR